MAQKPIKKPQKALKAVVVHKHPKANLQRKLDRLGVDYTEKDSTEDLRKKKLQANLAEKSTDISSAYSLFDAQDDQQILNELRGELVDKFVYSFEVDGKRVDGLSKAGTAEACRLSANNKGEVYRVISDPVIRDEGEYITVMVRVGRYKMFYDKRKNEVAEMLLDTTTGVKRQSKTFFRRSDRQKVPDPFFMEKAVSKAERNGKLTLLPMTFKLEVVKKYLGQKDQSHVQQLTLKTKIGKTQLKYLHGIGQVALGIKEYKQLHDKLTALAKEKYNYSTLNELDMTQVNEFAAFIKSKLSSSKKMSIELLGLCNTRGMLEAKRDTLWKMALDAADGDVVKAAELMKKDVERMRPDENKG